MPSARTVVTAAVQRIRLLRVPVPWRSRTSGAQPRSRASRLVGWVCVGVVNALVITAIVVGVGAANSSARTDDSGGWLASLPRSSVVHVNGNTGQVDGRVRLNGTSVGPLDVVQGGKNVLVLDHGTGEVSRIDPSQLTTAVTAGFSAPGSTLQLVSADDSAWVVDTAAGTVQNIDPVTLAARGAPINLGVTPLGEARVDSDGVLWVALPSKGTAVPIDDSAPGEGVKAGEPGDALHLVVANGMVASVDVHAATTTVLSSDAQGMTMRLPSGLSTADPARALVPDGNDSPLVPVLAPDTGLLVVANVDSGAVQAGQLDISGSHTYGSPQTQGPRVYIPDRSTGSLRVYNTSTAKFEADVKITGVPGGLELHARGGRIWVNDENNANAAVIDTDGVVHRIDKYNTDVPAAPSASATQSVSSASPTSGPSDDGSGSGEANPEDTAAVPPDPATTPGAGDDAGSGDVADAPDGSGGGADDTPAATTPDSAQTPGSEPANPSAPAAPAGAPAVTVTIPPPTVILPTITVPPPVQATVTVTAPPLPRTVQPPQAPTTTHTTTPTPTKTTPKATPTKGTPTKATPTRTTPKPGRTTSTPSKKPTPSHPTTTRTSSPPPGDNPDRRAPGRPKATSGNGVVTITFAPSSGDRPDRYELQGAPPGASITPKTVSAKGPFQFRVSNLRCTNDTEYRFTVVAVYGSKRLASQPSPGVRPCTAPDSPKIKSHHTSNHRVALSWQAPSGKGLSYRVTWKSGKGGPSGSRETSATALTISDLRNGLVYDVSVTAVNAAGSSAAAKVKVDMTPPKKQIKVQHNRKDGVTIGVRTGPSSDAGSRVTAIPDGYTGKVTVYCQTNGTREHRRDGTGVDSRIWDRITYKGKTGYVSDVYIATSRSGKGTWSPELWQCE